MALVILRLLFVRCHSIILNTVSVETLREKENIKCSKKLLTPFAFCTTVLLKLAAIISNLNCAIFHNTNMIATRFLSPGEYESYRTWLKHQDTATIDTYFGISASKEYIDNVVDGILSNPDEHNFLVAYRGSQWVGVIHLARISETDMEFGIIVDQPFRGQGIANDLMNEAVTWVRNRGFKTLYLHCLRTNGQMRHLATKFGLELHTLDSEIDAKTTLPPPSVITFTREAATAQKNIFFMALQQAWAPYQE